MDKLNETINKLTNSVTKSPAMSLLLIIFLVQSWIQVAKLDKINETLVSIHTDNVIIQEYIKQEKADSDKYEVAAQRVATRTDEIYQILITGVHK